MKFRRVISLTIAWAFICMALTGVVLFIVPHGRVAYWADWRLWGLSKTQWGDLHMTMGLLMLLAGACHIYLNWKPIVSYLRAKTREVRVFTPEFNTALLVALLFAGLSLLDAPPMSWLPDLGDTVKARAARIHGEPPYGHAEESRLGVFIQRMGLDESKSLTALEAAGIVWRDHDQTILEIASDNGLAPRDVYAAMQTAAPAPAGRLPLLAPTGLGRLTLSEMSERYGVPLPDLHAALSAAGIAADENDTLKDLAARAGNTPHGMYDTLRMNLAGMSDRPGRRP